MKLLAVSIFIDNCFWQNKIIKTPSRYKVYVDNTFKSYNFLTGQHNASYYHVLFFNLYLFVFLVSQSVHIALCLKITLVTFQCSAYIAAQQLQLPFTPLPSPLDRIASTTPCHQPVSIYPHYDHLMQCATMKDSFSGQTFMDPTQKTISLLQLSFPNLNLYLEKSSQRISAQFQKKKKHKILANRSIPLV